MRKPIIAGNWKMNNTVAEASNLLGDLIPRVNGIEDVEIVVCPPYLALSTVIELTKGTNIKVGAQNVAWADKGAFTGEVSASMLKEIGVEYVIIGHSERRQMFGETDVTVANRTVQALKFGLKPIVCVGETLKERENGTTEKVIAKQIRRGLKGVYKRDFKDVVIAYEPVWAIGTGKTATKEQAQETICFIRSEIAKRYGDNVAEIVRIQYGGSMNAANAKELMEMDDIDGGLIGGASLKAEDFCKVINFNK